MMNYLLEDSSSLVESWNVLLVDYWVGGPWYLPRRAMMIWRIPIIRVVTWSSDILGMRFWQRGNGGDRMRSGGLARSKAAENSTL